MARTAIATQQTVWDCRFSRPGFRLFGVVELLQPEKLWVCTRNGRRLGVTDEQCEHCPHWEMDDSKEN
jgi:hypothetical protein